MGTTAQDKGVQTESETQLRILHLVSNLKMWRKGEDTAPHKPILILYALTQCRQGSSRMIAYVAVQEALVPLLRAVQRGRAVVEPRYPFWRLQTDGLWEVEADAPLRRRRGNTDPLRSELITKNARGGFPPDVFRVFAGDSEFRRRVMRLVLERYFRDSEQETLRHLLGDF
jgi:putative restriction endonuclease